MQKKVIKTQLATIEQLDNLTGKLQEDIKKLDAMASDLKSFLSPINKAINLVSTIESGQELIEKELNAFRVDAKKLGIMADELPQFKRLDNTLVSSMRSLGSLIIALENISNVSKRV
jgi:SMC interacting uncharacterized protein involved in chromosome segregation